MDINSTTLIVAALGAGGLGAILREIFSGIGKIARGVSLKESTRKVDLVMERDDALRRARHSMNERDREERNRRAMENYAAYLQRIIILAGISEELPPLPDLEDTVTPAQLRKKIDPPAK